MKKLLKNAVGAGLLFCLTSLPLMAQIKTQTDTDTASERLKEGWSNVKEGAKDVAEGVSKAAQTTGHTLKSAACPVVADQSSGLYYAKDSPGYDKILAGERPFHPDNRICFATELAAREKNFRIAR